MRLGGFQVDFGSVLAWLGLIRARCAAGVAVAFGLLQGCGSASFVLHAPYAAVTRNRKCWACWGCGRPADQPTNQPNQPTNQPTNQPVSEPGLSPEPGLVKKNTGSPHQSLTKKKRRKEKKKQTPKRGTRELFCFFVFCLFFECGAKFRRTKVLMFSSTRQPFLARTCRFPLLLSALSWSNVSRRPTWSGGGRNPSVERSNRGAIFHDRFILCLSPAATNRFGRGLEVGG